MTDGTIHPRRRLTGHLRRHAVAYAALFVALGGTAYAADTIGSQDVIDDSLTSADIQDFQACGRSECLFTGGLGSNDLQPNAVITTRLANEAVTHEKIRPDAVDSGLIQNGQVREADLSRHAVTGDKIALGAVQNRHIASGAVNALQLGGDSVGTDALQDEAVAAGKLGNIKVVEDHQSKQTDKARIPLTARAVCPYYSVMLSGGGGAGGGASGAEIENFISTPFFGGTTSYWHASVTFDAGGIPGTHTYGVHARALCLMP
jgi:hypothetical protein